MYRKFIKVMKLTLCILAAAALWGGCSRTADTQEDAEIPTIMIGHVGHDHHLALFVAADISMNWSPESKLELRKKVDKRFYELYRDGKKAADIEIVRVGGGAKMPTALAQGVIDIGLGGTAPVLAAIDKGAPLKFVSPLHNKGDMLVVNPDLPVHNWAEFVGYVRNSKDPVRVGYKSPMAVAKVIFEDALGTAGLKFSGDLSDDDADVQMVNLKGGGKLNISLSQGLVDAYAGNNPFAAIAEEKELGRPICELESLPPGRFHNHPCCCIAASDKIVSNNPDLLAAVLKLMLSATDFINSKPEDAADIAARWIGTSREVELKSLPTSAYSMEASPRWHGGMATWLVAMNELGLFKGSLKGLSESEVAAIAYELGPLRTAGENHGKR